MAAFCLLLMLAFAQSALAASAEWVMQDKRTGRERITVRLNGISQPESISRIAPEAIALTWPSELLGAGGKSPESGAESDIKAVSLNAALRELSLPAPEGAVLFAGLVPYTDTDGQVRSVVVQLKNPAFGFISTRPDKDTLQIDIFNNPLGAKWTPPPAAAPEKSGSGAVKTDAESGQTDTAVRADVSDPAATDGSANSVVPGAIPETAETVSGAQSGQTEQAAKAAQEALEVQSAQSTQPAQSVRPDQSAQPASRGQIEQNGQSGSAAPGQIPADSTNRPASATQTGNIQSSVSSVAAQPEGQGTTEPVLNAGPSASHGTPSLPGAPGASDASGMAGQNGAVESSEASGVRPDFPALPSGVLNPSAQAGTRQGGGAISDGSEPAYANPQVQSAGAGQSAGTTGAVDGSGGLGTERAGSGDFSGTGTSGATGGAVFSPGAAYLQSGATAPADASGGALRSGNNPLPGLEDDEPGESFPVWPPLDMPNTLPSPPPPVYGNDAPGASLSPPVGNGLFALVSHLPGVTAANGDAVDLLLPACVEHDVLRARASLASGPALKESLARRVNGIYGYFFASTAMAATTGAAPGAEQSGTELIEAPFVYRSGLAKNGQKRTPEEEASQPVYVRVPTGTAARNAAEAEAASRPSSSSSGIAGQAARPGEQTAGQTAAPSAQTLPSPSPVAERPGQPAGQPGQFGAQTQTANLSGQSSQSGQAPSQPSGQTGGQQTGGNTQPSSAGTQAGGPAQTVQGGQSSQSGQPVAGGQSGVTSQDGNSAQQRPADVSQSSGQQPSFPTQPTPPENVIFVDEQGNPVEPPLDPKVASFDLQRLMNTDEYLPAFQLADKVLQQGNLTKEQREFFLHRRADAFFTIHREHPTDYFTEIMDYTTQAVNFNTRSARNAGAYLRLGYLNLKANNAYEAEAYFTLLRQQFPRDDGIALSYYYMGDYQYEQGNLNDAVLQFLRVVQDFPDSRYSRDAALGLTRTLYRLGYYDKAYEVIDYVEKRWPRYYLDYAPVLSMLGDTAYRARHIDRARQAYWLYYNLHPDAPDADVILSRLGDIYQSQKYRNAAVHVYEEAVRRFPDKDGGIIAMMRLAENGINDEPTLASMFKVFQQPFNLRPAEAYRKIIRDYPDSPLVTLAKLKLAMWSVWQKDFESAFRLCNEIVMADPNHPLAARALEVSRNAFALLAAESVNSKRYERVRDAWDRYPMLHTQEEFLDPESRLALAVSQWEGSSPDGALATIEPFFLGSKIPEYSEMALMLGLKILVDYDRWPAIEDLANRVEMWELTAETKNQLDYALGLAYESQGKGGAAMPLWKNLYEQNALPPEQQAYADYFLARQAESDGDLESAYRIGRDALQRLKDLAALNPEQADNEKIKSLLSSLMNISQSSGLLQDALNYGNEFMQYTERGSDDYLSVVYGMAALHRRRGSMGEWEKLLQELSENYPHTYYGKAAASQLSGYRMNRNASQFSPTGVLQ